MWKEEKFAVVDQVMIQQFRYQAIAAFYQDGLCFINRSVRVRKMYFLLSCLQKTKDIQTQIYFTLYYFIRHPVIVHK